MKRLLIDNRFFLVPFILFLTIFLAFELNYSKVEMHIWANQINSPFFDTFFMYATYLGDGTMIAVLTIVLLFVKYRYAVAFLAGSLLTSAVVHLFKKLLLEDMYRPSKYFELFETYQLYVIEGVTLRSLQSFPSGHTSTAFNIFLLLALLSKNQLLKLLYFFMAMVVAYSRVYLSQHFFVDIAAGSVIAVVTMLFIFYQTERLDRKWLDSSVLSKSFNS